IRQNHGSIFLEPFLEPFRFNGIIACVNQNEVLPYPFPKLSQKHPRFIYHPRGRKSEPGGFPVKGVYHGMTDTSRVSAVIPDSVADGGKKTYRNIGTNLVQLAVIAKFNVEIEH